MSPGDRGGLHFCIRDDDTSFFTSPDELERAYGAISARGPVSLAVVPYCRAGSNKAVPEELRNTGSVHPLHENAPLVGYLRDRVSAGRFEIMLHGYYHDDIHGRPEFSVEDADLERRVVEGRRYLEELLDTTVRVFVPPHNAIGRRGLQAVARAGLHLGGAAGLRGGWPLTSPGTWAAWWRLRRWRAEGGYGVPWVIDCGDHCEIAGNPVTPLSRLEQNRTALRQASEVGGVFCAATHYWEFSTPSAWAGDPNVRDHLAALIDQALSLPGARWASVGDAVARGSRLGATSS